MDQEKINAYAKKLVPHLAIEANAMILLANLFGLKNQKQTGDYTNDSHAESKYISNSVAVIHGNSLVAAHYREMTGESFSREKYFIFPIYNKMLLYTIKNLSGNDRRIKLQKINPNELHAFVFYGSGYANVKLQEIESHKDIKKLQDNLRQKIDVLDEKIELITLLKNKLQSLEE